MSDWWAWAAYGGTFALTTGVKVGCNVCVPGSAAAVDFCLAGKSLYDGDMTGTAINVFSGIADLASFGLTGTIQEAIKRGVKTATRAAVTETAKQTLKSASEEATKGVVVLVANNFVRTVSLHMHTQHQKINR